MDNLEENKQEDNIFESFDDKNKRKSGLRKSLSEF